MSRQNINTVRTLTIVCKRETNIVDNCQILFAIFDDSMTRDGTFQTINYATKQNKNMYILNPKTLEVTAIAAKPIKKQLSISIY